MDMDNKRKAMEKMKMMGKSARMDDMKKESGAAIPSSEMESMERDEDAGMFPGLKQLMGMVPDRPMEPSEEDRRKMEQVLRRESGAAITEEEMERARQMMEESPEDMEPEAEDDAFGLQEGLRSRDERMKKLDEMLRNR